MGYFSEWIALAKNREAIDRRSEVPLYHLGFLIQAFVREENMIKDVVEETGTTFIGSRANNLKISLRHSTMADVDCCIKRDISYLQYRSVEIRPDILAVPSKDKARDVDVIMIETEPKRPGYIRLQALYPQYHKDHTYWIDESTALIKYNKQPKQKTFTKQHLIHQGVTCLEWPEVASEWLSRYRPSGWPDQSCIASVKEGGCLALSRSHPLSHQREVEWQLIFPNAESVLMRALTDSQRYCLQVFKILVDFHLREFNIFLKTTTFKTIVFFACEGLPLDAWDRNLSGCLLYLLDKLYVHLRKKWLPNYFIQSNNMYDHLTEYEPLADSIYALRSFPAIGLFFLADHHDLQQMSLFDDTLEDFKDYRKHRDIRRSYHDVFLPNSLKLVSLYMLHERYGHAGRILQSSYEEVLNVAKEQEETPTFQEFVKNVLATENVEDRRYMFRFMDSEYGMQLEKTLRSDGEWVTLSEVDGIGELQHCRDEIIPRKCLGDEVHELAYILPIANGFMKEQRYSDAAVLLQKLAIKAKRFIDNFMVPDIVDDPALKRDLIEQTTMQLKTMNICQIMTYTKLHTCLSNLNEIDTFREHIQDYENLAREYDFYTALNDVADIWETLGNGEKAEKLRDEAKRSRDEKVNDMARAIMHKLTNLTGSSVDNMLRQFMQR